MEKQVESLKSFSIIQCKIGITLMRTQLEVLCVHKRLSCVYAHGRTLYLLQIAQSKETIAGSWRAKKVSVK